MKRQNIIVFLIFSYAIKSFASKCPQENQNNECTSQNNPEIPMNLFPQQHSAEFEESCETTIIFDISKNDTTKEIFDVSIKYFLKSISKYCDAFKYVIIDDKFEQECQNDCRVVFNDCKAVSSCNEIIDNMEYSNMTASDWSEEDVDGDCQTAKNYLKFLKKVFTEICSNTSVFLLTNRIISLGENSEIIQAIQNSSIKLTTILLGNGHVNATELLKNAYQNIPNSRALNFVNFDCFSYLFYCLIPCLSDTPECMLHDVTGCEFFSKWTPNYYPNKTLHVWYVFAFNSPFSNQSFTDVSYSLQKGFKDYIKTYDIKRYRYKVVLNDNVISKPLEDIEDFYTLFIWETGVNGDVVDDENEMNERLSLIPWNGTLTETRIGINSVIILTNYATTSLKTVVSGESLQGQMYVYNLKSFNYYSGVINNITKFVFYKSFYNDKIYINVNDSITATTTSATKPVTTLSASTFGQSSTIISAEATTFSSPVKTTTTISTVSTSTKPSPSSANYNSNKNCFKIFTFIVIF